MKSYHDKICLHTHHSFATIKYMNLKSHFHRCNTRKLNLHSSFIYLNNRINDRNSGLSTYIGDFAVVNFRDLTSID